MRIKSKRARRIWYERIEQTRDPVFGLVILGAAERWAELMEPYLDAGTSMSVVAEPTHRAATSGHADVALHTSLCNSMVDYLRTCWPYGKPLEKWYQAHTVPSPRC